jgi:hypothetical protein
MISRSKPWCSGDATVVTQGVEPPEQGPWSRGCGRCRGVARGIEPARCGAASSSESVVACNRLDSEVLLDRVSGQNGKPRVRVPSSTRACDHDPW